MTEALKIQGLGYRRNQKQILKDVSLTLPSGQIVGLLGANGAGKTTLMRLIAGSAVHFRGSISVAGVTPATQRKAKSSFSGQMDGFNPNYRVGQVADVMTALFPDFRTADFLQLAALYLLDEPFDGIDVMTRKAMLSSILRWTPEEATLVISDHHVEDIDQLLDQVVVIKDQSVVAQEAADTIRAQGQSIEAYFESFYGGEQHD